MKNEAVTPNPNGYFEVRSADSGKTYLVTPLGGDRADCTCAAGRNGRACKHVAAVKAHAAELMAGPVRTYHGPKEDDFGWRF